MLGYRLGVWAKRAMLIFDIHRNRRLILKILMAEKKLPICSNTMPLMPANQQTAFMPWELSFTIFPDDIRNIDIIEQSMSLLPAFLQTSCNINVLKTVFSELYANALEHGLLELPSSIKSDHNGFSRYYVLRKERLNSLKEGSIKVDMSVYRELSGIKLALGVEDSGHGFLVNTEECRPPDENKLWGRGMVVVKSLSERLHYSKKGRKAEVVIRLM